MSTITDDDIIHKFRDMVAKRYAYEQLSERFDLPPQITPEVIGEIKEYFMTSIYPEPEQRRELEEAFAGLGSYVRHPRKIWGLLGNMTRAVFQFGRQFPAALRAGMNSLDAFVGAKNFESDLVAHARELNVGRPITDEGFEQLMAQLPRREIEQFIEDVHKLIKTMTNTVLLDKTIHILDNVVETMKKKPGIYPKKEVDGILLGRSILQNGYDLFTSHDEATKQYMVEYIYRNEMWFTDHVFKKWN